MPIATPLEHNPGAALRDQFLHVLHLHAPPLFPQKQVQLLQLALDLPGRLAGEHHEQLQRLAIKIQPELATARFHHAHHLLLPALLAGVERVVDLHLGDLYQPLVKSPHLIDLGRAQDEVYPLGNTRF